MFTIFFSHLLFELKYLRVFLGQFIALLIDCTSQFAIFLLQPCQLFLHFSNFIRRSPVATMRCTAPLLWVLLRSGRSWDVGGDVVSFDEFVHEEVDAGVAHWVFFRIKIIIRMVFVGLTDDLRSIRLKKMSPYVT